MASNSANGKELLSIAEKIQFWAETVSEDDVKLLYNSDGNCLVKKKVCDELGISPSNFKGDSDAVVNNRDALSAFEQRLRDQGLMKEPSLESGEDSKTSGVKLTTSESTNNELRLALTKIKTLEKDLQRMTNNYLGEKAKVRKLEELASVVAEMGLVRYED